MPRGVLRAPGERGGAPGRDEHARARGARARPAAKARVPAEPTAGEVVVIIAQDDRVLGLLADGARGITRVPPADLRAVQADGGPLLFSHTFRHPEAGDVVSVLHVSEVLRLPGVPTVHDPAAARGGVLQVDERRAGTRRTLTVLRCGEHALGIAVEHVHTTLAGAFPKPSVFDSALTQGVTEYTDLHVAVVDPLELLGLGQLPGDRTGAGLVLKFEAGYVVLALTALVDITEVAAEEVLSLPAFSVRRPELLAGIADVEGTGQCLILDGDALLGDPDLQALASMNEAVESSADGAVAAAAGDEREAVSVAGRVYLTYSVGRDVATPLEQISEIIALPSARTLTEVGDAVLGVVVHRRAAAPVICLSTVLGLPRGPVTSATCLLLVPVDGDLVGFAVQALRAIDPLKWEKKQEPDADARGVVDVSQALRTAQLVSVGENPRLLPDLDLRAIARAVRAQMSGVPAGVLAEGAELVDDGPHDTLRALSAA